MSGTNITDHANGRGVFLGISQKLPLSGAWFPFGNLLAILKSWVQYIARTAKDTQTT